MKTSDDLREWKTEGSGRTEVDEFMHDDGYLERITLERPWESDPPERLFLSLQLPEMSVVGDTIERFEKSPQTVY